MCVFHRLYNYKDAFAWEQRHHASSDRGGTGLRQIGASSISNIVGRFGLRRSAVGCLALLSARLWCGTTSSQGGASNNFNF
jgi:hypothetical protein